MLSTLLDLLGFAAITAAVYVLAGPGFALLTGGVELLLLGLAADGVKPLALARERLRARRQGA